MILRLLLTTLVALCGLASANAQWLMHPSFDEYMGRLIDTPTQTYFLAAPELQASHIVALKNYKYFLYVYDKEAEELRTYTSNNYLSEMLASMVEYNREKGYLMLVYMNANIDILYPDGTVRNIPHYMMANMSESKTVNSITFDNDNNRAYLATDFGYVVIDTEKEEIAESRIYGEPLNSVARHGDLILIGTGDKLLYAPVKEPRLSLSDYQEMPGTYRAPQRFLPMTSELCGMLHKQGSDSDIVFLGIEDGKPVKKSTLHDSIVNVEPNRDGYIVATDTQLIQLNLDGTLQRLDRLDEDKQQSAGSWDMKNFWFSQPRIGFTSKRFADETWTVTRDLFKPNAPAPFMCSEMAYTSRYGAMVVNHGYDNNFTLASMKVPVLLSLYKDGEWTNNCPAYLNPVQTPAMYNPNGLAVDPADPSMVYFGSVCHGLLRLNLEDPADVIHLSRKGDPNPDLPGFVAIVDDIKKWEEQCSFSAPRFDADNRLWTAFNNNDAVPSLATLYYWDEANRKATKSAETYLANPMKKIELPTLSTGNFNIIQTLKSSGCRNVVIYSDGKASPITLFDHNGTPDDTSDDRVVSLANNAADQDGNKTEWYNIRDFYEDPATGLVWVAYNRGVFTFSPQRILEGGETISRIKVSRNDGTGLADYLLNEVTVNKIISDGQGRKWFATGGAGLICTSADGSNIIHEYTTDNSMIPDNTVYSLVYIPERNSILMSTTKGMTELSLSNTGGSDASSSDVRVMPNPVRPEYYGFVTIDGLPDNAIVKIVDGSGNLVRELDKAENGKTQWDTTNINHRKVTSGVYYVLSSSDSSDGNYSNVAKILVVR